MKTKQCAICKKSGDLFSIEIPFDEGDEVVFFTKYVCGSCWDVIAEITRRAVKATFEQQDKQLADLVNQITELEDKIRVHQFDHYANGG